MDWRNEEKTLEEASQTDRTHSPSTRLKIIESVPRSFKLSYGPQGIVTQANGNTLFLNTAPPHTKIATRSKNLGIEYAS